MNTQAIRQEIGIEKPYNVLVDTARQVCMEEDIDFDNCLSSVQRAMVCYWCSTCRSTHPLTHIALKRRKKICGVCNNNVKLYANSNKYGKIRRKIFYKFLEQRNDNNYDSQYVSHVRLGIAG
jgi:hypothetical protein